MGGIRRRRGCRGVRIGRIIEVGGWGGCMFYVGWMRMGMGMGIGWMGVCICDSMQYGYSKGMYVRI